MRILYFYRDDTVHDRRFLNALGKQPVDVMALRLECRENSPQDWKPPKNVQLASWSQGNAPFRWSAMPALIHEMKSLVKESKPDVIHAGPIDLCGYMAARGGFKPLVAMSWGYDLLVNAEKYQVNRSRVACTLNHTDILLGDCNAVREKARQHGFPGARIITFPWGVDLKTFHPDSTGIIRRKYGWENRIILLSTRALEKLYGCDVIVKAFIKAAPQDKRLCLILLGDGSQKEALMRRIASAGLEERVVSEGHIPESRIAPYFQGSDIYISASHSDGSSVSLLEAMACGLPPLVSNIPGNREWVKQERSGWLFEDGNSSDLSGRMLQAASSPRLRALYGKRACATIQKRANWDINSAKLLDAYKRAVVHHAGVKA